MLGIYLFGKPSWELELKKPLDPFVFVFKGNELHKRLESVGIMINKLQNNGWELVEPLNSPYCLYFWKAGMSEKRILNELNKLRISRDYVEMLDA